MTAWAVAGTDVERLLVRTEGGRLFDTLTRRPVTVEGLAGEVRRGSRFRVRDGESGSECTYQVLAQVLLTALAPAAPGVARPVGRSPGTVGLLSDAVGDGSSSGWNG
ncbi:polyhydroxyalkanoate synthesis regulator DNA-binding domain-containing protein [Streptomyces sp. NPDC048644]|uniref:polyhydroxyalkanoate synthesis regulator DNA-binding domain-containing protein n=1 Tax=Streptomyces sp. NPDC048644 TaxID=3365582 RepID=UPI00371C36F2